MELQWVRKLVWCGEYAQKEIRVLQYRESPDAEWKDVPVSNSVFGP